MRSSYFLFIIAFLIGCAGDGADASNDNSNSSTEDSIAIDLDEMDAENNDGKTVEYHPNGNIKMEGTINENGNREGLWISYYDNGSKWSESYYDDGLRDGHSLTFFPNGQIRYIGEYNNDEKVGTWTFYDEEGNVVNEETF